MPGQLLLIAMILLQLLWLAAIWWTGAASTPKKLLILWVYTLGVGLSAGWPGADAPAAIGRFLGQLSSLNQSLALLILTILPLASGAIYAYYQRLWPFDEENNFKATQMVAEGSLAAFFNNYAQIPWLGMQHPPLIPVVGGLLMRIFGKNLVVIRLMSVAMCAATVAITYLLGGLIYDQATGWWAALLLLSFPLILRQGSAAMLDMPVTFFFSLALLMTAHLPQSTSPDQLAVAIGLVIGIGALAKYTMLLIYAVLLPLFMMSEVYHPFSPLLPVIVLIPPGMLAIWLLYSARIGVLSKQINQLIIYSGNKSGNPDIQITAEQRTLKFKLTKGWRMRLRLETLFSRLPSALGVYNLPLIVLGLSRRVITPPQDSELLIILWIGALFILLILALPDHRYFMPIFPAIALLMAHELQSMPALANQVVVLALLYGGGALYLFVDWSRQNQLFIHTPYPISFKTKTHPNESSF